MEIAQRYADQIKLIVFEKNRGYGAAIKEGWRQSDADFLGFLDADGTCDPDFFATLCQALERDQSDVALGNRMHTRSKMPLVRRVGNFIFAGISDHVFLGKSAGYRQWHEGDPTIQLAQTDSSSGWHAFHSCHQRPGYPGPGLEGV